VTKHGRYFQNQDPNLVAIADKYADKFLITGDGTSHPDFGSRSYNFDIRSHDGRMAAFLRTPEGKQFRNEVRAAGYDIYFEKAGATSQTTADHYTINRSTPVGDNFFAIGEDGSIIGSTGNSMFLRNLQNTYGLSPTGVLDERTA